MVAVDGGGARHEGRPGSAAQRAPRGRRPAAPRAAAPPAQTGLGAAGRAGRAAVRPQADRRRRPRARRAAARPRASRRWTPRPSRSSPRACIARMFGAGRLQALLNDDDDREHRHQRLRRGLGDPRRRRTPRAGEPVATSDEELIELIQTLAAYAGLNSRPVGRRQPGAGPAAARRVPALGGHGRHRRGRRSRSAGTGSRRSSWPTWSATARSPMRPPSSSARRPGPVQRDDRRRHRAGKTTLLRAMAAEIGPEERIITVENALELGLRKDPDRHPNCVELEERVANSEGQGAISHGSAWCAAPCGMNPDRVIVGEVLGPEVDRHAQRDGPGQRRVAVDHPRPVRPRRVRPHRHLRHPGQERLPHEASLPADRRRPGLRRVHQPAPQHRASGGWTPILEVNGYDDAGAGLGDLRRRPRSGSATWTGTMPARHRPAGRSRLAAAAQAEGGERACP